MSIDPADKHGSEIVRTQSIGCGPDVEHLKGMEANPVLHPNDGLEQEIHFVMLAPCEGRYITLYEYGWYMPNHTGKFGSYSADVRLATSRDGNCFQRVQPHQKVIERGPRGTWDEGFLIITDKPIVKDDTIYLYYCGNGEEWTSWPWQNKMDHYADIRTGWMHLSRMGLATLRRDDYVCVETADRETPGFLTSGPVELSGKELGLEINISDVQPGHSWIEVEGLDAESGELLPGFGREDCVDLCCDGVDVAVQWKAAKLAGLGARRCKLRFHLMGAARLYSYAIGMRCGWHNGGSAKQLCSEASAPWFLKGM